MNSAWPSRTSGPPLGPWPGRTYSTVKCLGGADDLGPIADVGVGGEVIGAVDHGVAGAEHVFLGQIDETIAAGVGPAVEIEADFASAVLEDEGALVKGLGAVRGGLEVADIGAVLGGGLPAGGFEAFHFFGDADVGEGRGAGFGPDGVAVGVVAVVVRVEDVLDRLIGDSFGGLPG